VPGLHRTKHNGLSFARHGFHDGIPMWQENPKAVWARPRDRGAGQTVGDPGSGRPGPRQEAFRAPASLSIRSPFSLTGFPPRPKCREK